MLKNEPGELLDLPLHSFDDCRVKGTFLELSQRHAPSKFIVAHSATGAGCGCGVRSDIQLIDPRDISDFCEVLS